MTESTNVHAPFAYEDLASLPTSESARVGRLLALRGGTDLDDVALARRVSQGLMPRSAIALGRTLSTVLRMDAELIPEATLRRAVKGEKRLSRDHSERLYEMGRVIDAAGRLFRGDRESIRAFLTRPHPMLGGESPIAMARSGSAGCTAVLNVIRRAEACVVV